MDFFDVCDRQPRLAASHPEPAWPLRIGLPLWHPQLQWPAILSMRIEMNQSERSESAKRTQCKAHAVQRFEKIKVRSKARHVKASDR